MEIQNKDTVMEQIKNQFPKIEDRFLIRAIQECIDCRMISYYTFLVTKIDLKQVKHKKIVQKIFSKYIPNKKKLSLQYYPSFRPPRTPNIKKSKIFYHQQENEDGNSIDSNLLKEQDIRISVQKQEDIDKMKFLVEGLKQLPNNLDDLFLYLSGYKLHIKTEIKIKFLPQVIKSLPSYLKKFEFDLSHNSLGCNEQNMEGIVEGMKYLPCQLQILSLNFSENNLGTNIQNISYLGQVIKFLPNQLQLLILDLSSNNLGANMENIKLLGEIIKQLPHNIQNLNLNLQNNNIEEDKIEEFQNDFSGIFDKIKTLELVK